jgi:hypothetical protein
MLFLGALLCALVSARLHSSPYQGTNAFAVQNEIDRIVLAKLNELQIKPATQCSDAVFVRRAFVDVIGTVPTAVEARDFLGDRNPKKRAILIDRLLEREEFVDYWSMKWCDLLRVKAEFPINLWPNAVQAYHRWIHTCLKENIPYDRFARELLTASGSNFRVPPVNFYRAMQNHDPEGIAQTVALTFMGVRAEKWPKERLAGLSAFFSLIGYKSTGEWKEEIVFFDPSKATNNVWQAAAFPDGQPFKITLDRDPREAFADWLVIARNRSFTRCVANRVWAWLLGRGIVEEPDDLREDNPPQNEALLALLEKKLIERDYDLKQLYRFILNSSTYQASSVYDGSRSEAEANFACYPLRQLEAEVLIDALNEITASTEKYSSAIPEPFTFIPEDQRSITLADGSITSSFLELFGRPSRDTGLCSERNLRPSASQRLHLLNSTHIQRKLEQSRKLQALLQSRKPPREIANGLYLMILSRFPTETELRTIDSYSRSGEARGRDAFLDVAWALLNSSEFLYRH